MPFSASRRAGARSIKTAAGGGVFEDAVAAFAQRHLGGHGYVVDPTGNVVGLRPSCKVGDLVIHFPADHAFAGHRVAISSAASERLSRHAHCMRRYPTSSEQVLWQATISSRRGGNWSSRSMGAVTRSERRPHFGHAATGRVSRAETIGVS
jgi:hypothetical protein